MTDGSEGGAVKRLRLEVRVSPEQDALIREAATIRLSTVTSFVLDSATTRAREVVEAHRDLVLAPEAFDRFIAALDDPPAPVPELVELFKDHRPLPEG